MSFLPFKNCLLAGLMEQSNTTAFRLFEGAYHWPMKILPNSKLPVAIQTWFADRDQPIYRPDETENLMLVDT